MPPLKDWIDADDATRPGGLDHHDADVVGHDIVQFAGDAGAFFRDGLSGLRFPLYLELGRPILELFRVR